MRTALCLLALASALTLVGAAPADTSLTDPTGDAGAAPDIKLTDVAHDSAAGAVAFRVTVANPFAARSGVFIYFDTDRNASTGMPSFADSTGGIFRGGNELYIYDVIYPGAVSCGALRWTGSTLQVVPPAVRCDSTVPGVITFTVPYSVLGLSTGASFDFFMQSVQFNEQVNGALGRDYFPESGAVTYQLTATMHLTVQKTGAGTGTVKDTTSTLNCGSTCFVKLDQGKTETLVATADSDSIFAGWSGGGCSGTNPTCTLTTAGDTTITATFAKRMYTLTVKKVGGGTVTSGPAGIACGKKCAASFLPGTITLTARPATGYGFSRWLGVCHGTATRCRIQLNGRASATAVFKKK